MAALWRKYRHRWEKWLQNDQKRRLIWEIVFVTTGMLTTLSYQEIFNQGGGEAKTLFPATAKYFGYFLAILIPKQQQQQQISKSEIKSPMSLRAMFQEKSIPHTKLLLSSIFEFLSHVFGFLGLAYVGSGMYQVVYSTVVIFTALMGHFLLKRLINFRQWIAVVVVTIGLLCTSLPPTYFEDIKWNELHLIISGGGGNNDDVNNNKNNYEYEYDNEEEGSFIRYNEIYYQFPYRFWEDMIGIALVLCSTFLISINYIISDSIMNANFHQTTHHPQHHNDDNDECEERKQGGVISTPQYQTSQSSPSPPSPIIVQTLTGAYTFSLCIIYTLVYTLPHLQEIFFYEIKMKKGDLLSIILLYIFVTVNSFLHNYAFYAIIGEVGALTFGLMQAVRAVGVFFGSSFLFCPKQQNQCFSTPKMIATFFVIIGVILFSYRLQFCSFFGRGNGRKEGKEEEREDERRDEENDDDDDGYVGSTSLHIASLENGEADGHHHHRHKPRVVNDDV